MGGDESTEWWEDGVKEEEEEEDEGEREVEEVWV